MPTILLLDVSLSMLRPIDMPDCSEEYQRRHLAIHGINSFLEHCTHHNKMEFISLILFSSLYEQVCAFTRDYETIKTALNTVEEYNKTCLATALSGMSQSVCEEWGPSTPCQLIIVTDGGAGVGNGSLLQLMANREAGIIDDKPQIPLPFPCKIHVMAVDNSEDSSFQKSRLLYQKLIELNGQGGEVFVPEGPLTLKSAEQMFSKMTDKYYSPFLGVLKCGHLTCNVQVFPAVEPCEETKDNEIIEHKVNKEIEICGFLDMNDVASPPFISRHMVLPTVLPVEGVKAENAEELEEGKVPTFTGLLHGSLKVKGMVALAKLSEEWYGILYSWADSKKKSNLMMSVFEPGIEALPWLGNLDRLAPAADFSPNPYGEDDGQTPFPLRPSDRRSYAQNCVVWVKQTGLQADIQKVLRHGRKLPEKQQHFYKELNRVRRAALSFGFVELLDAMASLLERECTQLPGNAHPDAALQLTHSASALRLDNAKDFAHTISPLRTNFSAD